VGIDRTPPVVTIGGVADGKTYALGSVPTATCSATDQLTGLDGACAVSVTGGNASDVGSFTVSATARDRVGNSTTVKASYDVHYPWSGFLQPINDTAHEVSASTSVFKAGSTVPVKFSLRDAAGRVLAPTSTPVWVTPVKGSSTNLPVGEPEFTDAPDAGIVYQLRDGQWKYNWKTDRSQAGSYWRIGVRLDDGSVHQVTIALQ
jgi:hypothetical protein